MACSKKKWYMALINKVIPKSNNSIHLATNKLKIRKLHQSLLESRRHTLTL